MLPNSKGGWEAQRPVRRRKSVTHYSDDNPQTFTTKPGTVSDAKVEAPSVPKQRTVPTKKPGKRKARDGVGVSSSSLPPEPPDNAVVHTAAYQPILPLQLFPWSDSQRISTTAALWSDRVVPPAGLAPKGPTWHEVAPTTTHPISSTLPSSLPPPPITWFALREDDRSYAIAGDGAGCLSLYHLSSSPTRPLIVIRETLAAQREFTLRRPVSSESNKPIKRTFVSYPNAIVQCAWCRHIICLWTADEMEVLHLSRNSRATTIASWPLSQFQVSASSSFSSAKRSGGNQNATTTPCLSIAPPVHDESNIYRLLWTTYSTTDATSPTLLQADLSVQENDDNDDPASESPWASSITRDCHSTPQLASVHWYSHTLDDGAPWRCWTTLWEPPSPGETDGTILALAQTGPDTVELLRTRRIETTTVFSDAASSDSPSQSRLQVLVRQSVPSGRSNNATTTDALPGSDYLWPIPDCCLQQFLNQPFTFLSAARGIRMYRTATLEAVALFGDTVQLHGKAVVWSRCAWVPAARLSAPVRVDATNLTAANHTSATTVLAAVSKKKHIWWLERSDELALREIEKEQKDNLVLPKTKGEEVAAAKEDDLIQEYWLLGVPHPHLGPSELRTSLYLWKPGASAGETTATLHLPAGGCLGDLYVAPECRHMVGVGAETGRLSDWQPILRTDFAGVMYPVGYKVIMDNLEYIEDEDELDEVVSAEEMMDSSEEPAQRDVSGLLASTVDPDLAEAMRLSLLELQQQQNDAAPRVDQISVLCEESATEDAVWVVPCFPEHSGTDGDEHSVTSSPKRGRALSHISLEDAFEDSFLQSLPQTRSVRAEVETLQLKRSQLQTAGESGSVVVEKAKAKPKRARIANIEALLQSSMDLNLRRDMGLLRGAWAELSVRDVKPPVASEASEGTEPNLVSNGVPIRNHTSSSLVHGASPEEKSLALELLRLSPSPEMPNRSGNSKAVAMELQDVSGKDAPSESAISPLKIQATDSAVSCDSVQDHVMLFSPQSRLPEQQHCRACMGRFVLHSCGLREKPIDYDAIARREKEEKEREEEERQRERELKRRLAEAKRREARKQKKIDNERKKVLENQQLNMQMNDTRFQHSEEVRSDFMGNQNVWELQNTYQDDNHFAEHCSDQGMEDPSNSEPTDDDNEYDAPVESTRNGESQANAYSYSSIGSWQQSQPVNEGVKHRDVIHIGGNEVNPSTSLHPMDALEALAGLADSMAKPVLLNNTPHHFTPSDQWSSNTTGPYLEQNHFKGYDAHHSESHSFSSALNVEPTSAVGQSEQFFPRSAVPEPVLESFPSDDMKANVTPISHVDYRDGGYTGIVTKLEVPATMNPTASASGPAALPSLHKPTMDSSLDQALILVEMAESAIVHGPQQLHHSPSDSLTPRESMTHKDTASNNYAEQIKGVTEDHSLEAEALLAFALSASPKSSERPLVRLDGAWTPQIERRVTQPMYDFSPSSPQSCYGSTSTTTHAIVVSQFLQQPMAAGLVNVTSAADNGDAVAKADDSAEPDAILEEGTTS